MPSGGVYQLMDWTRGDESIKGGCVARAGENRLFHDLFVGGLGWGGGWADIWGGTGW